MSTIYVYDEDKYNRKWAAVQIFVNDELLAALPGASYVTKAVPAGSIVITPTYQAAFLLGPHSLQPLRWPKCEGDPQKPSCTWDPAAQSLTKEDHGCGKVEWHRVGKESKEDLELCSRELEGTSCALDNWLDPGRKPGSILAGLLLPGVLGNAAMANAFSCPGGDLSAWLQMCGSKPFPKASSPEGREEAKKINSDLKHKDFSDDWSRCRDGVGTVSTIVQWKLQQSKATLRIELEAGKTYYIEFHRRTDDLKAVDASTGAKEIIRLRPATD